MLTAACRRAVAEPSLLIPGSLASPDRTLSLSKDLKWNAIFYWNLVEWLLNVSLKSGLLLWVTISTHVKTIRFVSSANQSRMDIVEASGCSYQIVNGCYIGLQQARTLFYCIAWSLAQLPLNTLAPNRTHYFGNAHDRPVPKRFRNKILQRKRCKRCSRPLVDSLQLFYSSSTPENQRAFGSSIFISGKSNPRLYFMADLTADNWMWSISR